MWGEGNTRRMGLSENSSSFPTSSGQRSWKRRPYWHRITFLLAVLFMVAPVLGQQDLIVDIKIHGNRRIPAGVIGSTIIARHYEGILASWNEFLLAAALTRTPEAQTMPVGIASYVTSFQTDWGQLTANGILYMVPILAATIIAQKGLIRGMTEGALKG